MFKRVSSPAGFTLPELLIALALFLTMAGSALALFQSTASDFRVNSQVNRVLNLLRNGRESAITRQRLHFVTFTAATSTVALTRLEGTTQIPVESVVFEAGLRIAIPNSAPDTPEGYGSSGAINFGTATSTAFDSEGSFVDQNGVPINGTVYLSIPGVSTSPRAITITGSTGRARFYYWNSQAQWMNGWLAK